MNALPQVRMSVDQFLAWAEGQPGRYELADGMVHAMAPETAGHAERKAAVYSALSAGIRARGLNCHALPDGMTVRIDEITAYEPDALVYCGGKISPSSIQVPNPLIVVEVLSPSTSRRGSGGRNSHASFPCIFLPVTARRSTASALRSWRFRVLHRSIPFSSNS